jgi:hypothetical protein
MGKYLICTILLALPLSAQRRNYAEITNGPGIPITQYGAVSGATDSLAAFNAAYALNDNVMVPAGTWNLSSGNFIMTRSNTSLRCEMGAVIVYTGPSPIDSAITVGSVSSIYNARIEGCTIKGNSHALNALHILHAHHSVFRNLRLKDAVTAVFVDTTVSAELDNIEVSGLSGHFAFEPSWGIDVFSSNSININLPTIEAMAASRRPAGYPGGVGIGIRVRSSFSVRVTEGTSESNNIGVSFDSATAGSKVDTMDNEDNVYADVDDSGRDDVVTGGLYSGSCSSFCGSATHVSVHYGSTAQEGLAEGFIGSIVRIDAGAKGTTVINANLGNVECCVVNNGSLTTLISNYNCCGAAAGPLPNLITGVMVSGRPGYPAGITDSMTVQPGQNVISDDPSGLNNALVAFLKDPNGNPVPVVAGLRVTIRLTHSLRAGPNTLDLNGSGAMPILKPTDGNNLTVPYIGSGLYIDLMNYGGTKWLAMAAQ